MFVWFLMLNHSVKTKLKNVLNMKLKMSFGCFNGVEIVFFTLINRETDGFMNKNE